MPEHLAVGGRRSTPPRLTPRSASFSASQPPVSPSLMKQMSWLSGLSATASPRRDASSRITRLGGVAEREHRVRELVLGEHAEHVGLVLGHVLGAVHLDQPVRRRCAAARSDRLRPRRSRARWPRSSTAANLIFSLQRRHGLGVRPSAYSLEEVLDHVLVEPLAQVPDVERDADHVGRPPRVVGVLDGAAAARTGAVGLRVAREREVDAGDVVPLLRGARRGHGRVDAARHRCQDAHQAVTDARRGGPGDQRGVAGAFDDRRDRLDERVDVGLGVEVWPRENRSEERANSSA